MPKPRKTAPGPGTGPGAGPGRADLPPLQDALSVQLLRARESVMAWFRPNLREHGVTEHQWRVMRALAEARGPEVQGPEVQGLEMQELSALCHVQPPSLSRIMPTLEQRGLVRRGSHPNDQRRVLAALTPAGRRLIASASAESHRVYQALIAAVGAQRLADLQTALDEVIARLEARHGTPPDRPGAAGPERQART